MRNEFLISSINKEGLSIYEEFVSILDSSGKPESAYLLEELNQIDLKGDSDDNMFKLAFVGQYDSGKSTILKALTDNPDIVIDADVCTAEVSDYRWNNILVMDTPGICAGYREHDEKTNRAIQKADLLVFVITSELFDETIGKHFWELAYEKHKADEILLVVNKMGQDPGTPLTKKQDINKVLNPRNAEDYLTIFIDAKAWLDAKDENDADDRRELEEVSNFPALIEAMNTHVKNRGTVGRITTPLFMMQRLIDDTVKNISYITPEEKGILELLSRRRKNLANSKLRLKETIGRLANSKRADILGYADTVIDTLNGEHSKEKIKEAFTVNSRNVRVDCEKLKQEIAEIISEEFHTLQEELSGLINSPLYGELAKTLQVNTGPDNYKTGDLESKLSKGFDNYKNGKEINAENSIEEIDKAVSTLSKVTMELSRNNNGEYGIGSHTYEFLEWVGNTIKIDSEMWDPEAITKVLGNFSEVVNNMMPVIDVLASLFFRCYNQSVNCRLDDFKKDIRNKYIDAAGEMEKYCDMYYERLNSEYYSKNIALVDKFYKDIIDKKEKTDQTGESLRLLRSRLNMLINRAHRWGEVSQGDSQRQLNTVPRPNDLTDQLTKKPCMN